MDVLFLHPPFLLQLFHYFFLYLWLLNLRYISNKPKYIYPNDPEPNYYPIANFPAILVSLIFSTISFYLNLIYFAIKYYNNIIIKC